MRFFFIAALLTVFAAVGMTEAFYFGPDTSALDLEELLNDDNSPYFEKRGMLDEDFSTEQEKRSGSSEVLMRNLKLRPVYGRRRRAASLW